MLTQAKDLVATNPDVLFATGTPAKPDDLPVQGPVKFEFAVNQKMAHALDLKVPQTIVLRADRVVE